MQLERQLTTNEERTEVMTDNPLLYDTHIDYTEPSAVFAELCINQLLADAINETKIDTLERMLRKDGVILALS